MKRHIMRALLLFLCVTLMPASGAAEEPDEIDLYSPEIYAGDLAEPPADSPAAPTEPSPGGEGAERSEADEVSTNVIDTPSDTPAEQPTDPQKPSPDGSPSARESVQWTDSSGSSASGNSPVDCFQQERVGRPPSDGSADPRDGAERSEADEVPSPETPTDQPTDTPSSPLPLPATLTLGLKETLLLASPLPADAQPVVYVSSKPKVADVDASGVVTAKKKGTATITRFVGGAPLDSCQVTVLKAPKKVQLPGDSVVLSAGEARSFAASLPKGYAGTIAYFSDNPAVFTVDASGNLLGVSGGSAVLTATAYNGKSARCAVRVLAGPAPTWLTVEPAALQLSVKGTAALTASYDAGCDAALSYASSNPKVVSVTGDGTVTAKKAGEATITVATHNGLSASCRVQVFTAPKKVTLNAKKLTLGPNDGYQLTATLTKHSVSEITWTTSDPAVATVDASGLVAAVGVGKATIAATTTNGKKATCKVTVQGGGDAGAVDRHGNLVYQEESETLKVRIVNDRGIFLAYVWVKDPSRQLFKQYGNDAPYALLQSAVDGDASLRDNIILGFNASSGVNDKFHTVLNKDPVYSHREPSPLMIANGEVLSNDPQKSVPNLQLYWLDGGGRLRFTPRALEDMTAQERAALYRDIIDSGARNTIVWYPPLIEDGKALPVADWIQRRFSGKLRKQAFCQVDDNNFIIVSTNIKGGMTFSSLQKYLLRLGVRTAVTLDGGNSASMLVKPKGSAKVERVNGGSRRLSMVMYFTELE